MCGIVGVFSYGSTRASITTELLVRMRDTMVHRGPDDEGVYLSADGRVGLGFRRLSILDLSTAGRQPMANARGDRWIVYNGEVYNFRELRAELEAKGHRFRSQSDTEVLLALYDEYGRAMVHRLRGMFAFAIWDEGERTLWLARDRIGVKPLYYTFANGVFLFASEIKALLAYPGVVPRVDLEAFYHYLSFLTTPAPSTLFADIAKLPAGHTLLIGLEGNAKLEEYWDVFDNVQPLAEQREEAYTERLLDLLRESIRYRMISDVPFGVFLSGGIDSSTNVALMAELMNRPVETFTVGFVGQERYNEFHHAREIARRFRTNHHEVQITVADLIAFLPQLIHHQDEPIADPVCVPVYYVARLAKEHGVTVCQVGEGSDELFCGYPAWAWVLRIERWNRAYTHLPRLLRRLALRGFGAIADGESPPYELLRRGTEGEVLFWGGAEAFTEGQKARLLSQRLRERLRGLTSHQVILGLHQRFRERSPIPDYLHWMGYLDLRMRLPELLLMRVDKMTMATSVEARVPFLDHKFVEFAMGIPQAVKVRGGILKHILKRAVEPILPAAIIHRPKQGFGVPVVEWFLEGLGDLARTTLLAFNRRHGYFDDATLDGLLATRSVLVWYLLNFALWHEAWIEGKPISSAVAGGD